MVGSPQGNSREKVTFEPEIIGVHSHSRDDDVSDTDNCSRCFTMSSGEQCGTVHVPPGTEDQEEALLDNTTERDLLEEEEEEGLKKEGLKESEFEGLKESDLIEGVAVEKNDLSIDDMNSKLRFIFHLDGLKEAGGLLYIGCENDREKTNPSKIMEWFSADFLNLHRVYAIREEEPFLLKVFTRHHEISNRGIRKKGGRKVMLMGKEVFGDVLLACGHCGYWSREGSNVRRHLKKAVCRRERGYCKDQLAGMDRMERRRFLRRMAAAKCRAKKKVRALSEGSDGRLAVEDGTSPRIINTTTNTTTTATTNTTTTTATTATTNTTTTTVTDYPPCPLESSDEPFAECLVEIEEHCYPGDDGKTPPLPTSPQHQQQAKRRVVRHKALLLGPAVIQEAVMRASYDIFTVNENNERLAWKPPQCHKKCPGDPCQIVFKGARMKRRCLDLPLPRVLIYRKLDCKTHRCNFTLFHPSARAAFHCDSDAKASVDIKMYGDIVMTQEFYHYFVSLLSIMKMKSSQTARHLTSVWETILAQRLGVSTVPEEHRKIITLSKQTVKSIWSSIEEEAENRGPIRPSKGTRRRKKLPPPVLPSSVPVPPPFPLPPSTMAPFSSGVDVCGMTQPPSVHPCMKRLNPIAPKPPPLPPPLNHPPPPSTHPPSTHAHPVPPKSSMMPLPPQPHPHPAPPHPSHHNGMQQAAPHTAVNHTHWLSQPPQYPHNMAPYPMAPHHPSAEYYPVPSHFMTQYTPASMGTSP